MASTEPYFPGNYNLASLFNQGLVDQGKSIAEQALGVAQAYKDEFEKSQSNLSETVATLEQALKIISQQEQLIDALSRRNRQLELELQMSKGGREPVLLTVFEKP